MEQAIKTMIKNCTTELTIQFPTLLSKSDQEVPFYKYNVKLILL